MRVLYVDDDRINSLLFVETARWLQGFEVEVAASGGEACDAVLAWMPELMVIDLHLPDTNGYALLERLRTANPALAGVPAVLCTAEDLADVVDQARAAGFASCWAKPVDRALLLNARMLSSTQAAS